MKRASCTLTVSAVTSTCDARIGWAEAATEKFGLAVASATLAAPRRGTSPNIVKGEL